MHPVLFQFGPITIYTYGVLVATGVLLGLWYARRQAPRAGLGRDTIWNLGIYMVVAALVAAKVWLVLSDWEYYMANPGAILSAATLQSGGTFYGGMLGGALAIVLYAYFYDLPALSVSDTFAAAIPLGHAIGRLGCFAAGCCYGKPTTLPWGVTFTSEVAERLAGTPLGVPLHPTQLYEAAAEFLNFLLLVWLGARQRFTGQMIGAYFILYGIERGTIELFRGDPGRTLLFHGELSLMQVVSLGLVLTGALLWWRGLRRMGQIDAATPAPARAHAEGSPRAS
jgi:phosphatidylglycerol---prolipoprotein diacylglyceryl transferase